MSLADSLQGSAYFLPTLAAALVAAHLLVRRRFHYLAGVQRLLAFSLLATTALIFAHVIPAALGILDRPTALVASLLILAASWRVGPGPVTGRERSPAPEPAPSSVPSIVIAVLAVAIVLVYQLARLRLYANHLPDFIDAVGFHLPGVATWIQTGTLWHVDQFLPGFATAQYPNNGDFVILASVLPWHDLALVRISMVPFFALTGVGTYALAVEAGASRAASSTFAAAVITVPYISHYSFEGIPDLITLSMFATGVLFTLRYARSGLRSDLVLAGLALGVSLGTKWYGLTSVAVTGVVVLAIWLLMRRPLRDTIGDTGVILGMIALGGGIWLLRNLIESGNPIYPKTVSVLGVQLFAGSHHDVIDQYGYTIAHYLGQPSILRKYIYPGFKIAIGFTGLLIVVGLVIVTARSLMTWRRRSADRAALARPAALLGITVGIFVIYTITPGTAYGPENLPLGGFPTLRWLMPAVLVGAAVAALAVRHLGRAGPLLELAGLAGVIEGIRLGDDIALGNIVRVSLFLALVLGAVARERRSMPAARRAQLRRSRALATISVALVLAAALGIWLQQRRFDRQTYAPYDPVFAWIVDHAPSGHRVGITGEADLNGIAPVLPVAGPRLGNRLGYVGDVVAHSVQLPATADSFRADLARGRYDLLEIGLQYTGHTDQWARALGYRLVATSGRLALYAAPGFTNQQIR